MNKSAVIISCFNWYDMRLVYIYDFFSECGYDVKIITSDFDHQSKKTIIKKNNLCEYIETIQYKKNLSVRRILSHYEFARKVYTKLKKYKPDVVYALVPPNSVGKICYKYKEEFGGILIADIIDMWPESTPTRNVFLRMIYDKWAKYRDDMIKKSDFVFTECELYKKKMRSIIDPMKSKTLYLCKEQNNIITNKLYINKASKDREINLCYLGSINNIIDMEAICNIVLALTSKFKVIVNIIGDGEKKIEFITRLQECKCLIEDYGVVYDDKKKREIMSKCEFAFNLMKSYVTVGLTTKSVEYLCYGIPIINNLKGDTWDIVEKYNIGINYEGNVDDIINYVDYVDYDTVKKNVYKCFNENFSITAFKNTLKENLLKLL